MSHHRLVCASCAGPVSEGRCPVCRRYRAEVQRHDLNWFAIALLALIAAVIAGLLVTAAHVTA